MADDLGNRNSPDRERINVNEDYGVRDWTKKFGVSEDGLRRAVQAVGDLADAVRSICAAERNEPGTAVGQPAQ